MTNINITNLRKNLFDYINQAVEFNDIINVNTKNGNAVIISEDDYNGLMETLYLSGNPIVKKELIDGMKTPVEECIPEDEVEW
jgi:antitoxin YefM